MSSKLVFYNNCLRTRKEYNGSTTKNGSNTEGEKIMKKEVIVEVKNMNKRFGSTIALKDVDIEVRRGEIQGLIGENGSGKSTVTSIISGMQKANSGEMFFKGERWTPASMLDALENGIGMIVQESGTVPGITVAENIFLGEIEQFQAWKIGKKSCGPIDRKRMNESAKKALTDIGIMNIEPTAIMAQLDFQSRKLVEIAKVMLKKPQLLIIDETSTALAQDGREILYQIINSFRGTDKAVIFISHDLDEIMEVCDKLTVLRDGNIIRTFEKEEFEPDEIRKAMIGRNLQGDYYRSDYNGACEQEVVLECIDMNLGEQLKDVCVQLHKGEILGIGGLAQCGMHELGKVLFGIASPESGKVVVRQGAEAVRVKNETVAMKYGMGYVSKDRDVESLNLSASIKDNIAIAGMEKYAVKNTLILNSREKKYVDEQIAALSVKCSDRNQLVQQLSGGNKQKVVFGKWIGRDTEILILDCPTRGVDIGVKQAMYQLMTKLKAEGKAILLISEELPELIGMSDRILIMKDGRISKEFERSADLSDADIIGYMI